MWAFWHASAFSEPVADCSGGLWRGVPYEVRILTELLLLLGLGVEMAKFAGFFVVVCFFRHVVGSWG